MSAPRRIATGLFAVLLAAGMAACGDEPAPEVGAATDAVELDAATLGVIGGKIYLDPESADAILEDEGLTRAVFEARVREVSSDPEAAREYAAAFQEETAEAGEISPAEESGGG